jgi:hypothetical protein
MKLLRFMRDSVPADPHLWIAFAAAAGFLLFEMLGLLEGAELDKTKGVQLIIMIAILSLTVDGLKTGKERRQSAETLERLAERTNDKRVALRRRPANRQDYFYLWGNFAGRYCAYSPAYRVENITGEDKILPVYVQRYQDPDFERADYIFLTGDERGQQDLANFRSLMARLKKIVPECEAKINVRELSTKPAASSAEIYIGNRDGRPNAVVELRDPMLGPSHGIAFFYCIIDDQQIIENHLQKDFDDEWAIATPVPLFP